MRCEMVDTGTKKNTHTYDTLKLKWNCWRVFFSKLVNASNVQLVGWLLFSFYGDISCSTKKNQTKILNTEVLAWILNPKPYLLWVCHNGTHTGRHCTAAICIRTHAISKMNNSHQLLLPTYASMHSISYSYDPRLSSFSFIHIHSAANDFISISFRIRI